MVNFSFFKGCHCDVGGGSVKNETRYSLARIPLRWMIRECFKANTGIMFHSEALRYIGLDPATLHPSVTPRQSPKTITPEHKIRKLPDNPIPVSHTTSAEKRPAEIHTRHAAPNPPLGSEEEEELHDALSPVYDQLKLKRWWWILEILPICQQQHRGGEESVIKFS